MSILIFQFIPPCLSPLVAIVYFLHLWLYFSFIDKFICTTFKKDFTYKQYHTCLCLTYFTLSDNLKKSKDQYIMSLFILAISYQVFGN